MRLPWVRRKLYEYAHQHALEQHAHHLAALDMLADAAKQRDEAREDSQRALAQVLQCEGERDEALARVADLERALGQFSAGEVATDDTADLCDCPVSVVNEHLTGYCRQALIEANDAGEMTGQPQELLDAAKESATRGQGHATKLCDCELATLNTHLEGSCRQALIEAEQQGRFIGEYGAELRQIKQKALGVGDCTCPPGWKHRAADCPFNPNPEREHRQRYG